MGYIAVRDRVVDGARHGSRMAPVIGTACSTGITIKMIVGKTDLGRGAPWRPFSVDRRRIVIGREGAALARPLDFALLAWQDCAARFAR